MRQEAQDAIGESEESCRALVEAAPVGIVVTDFAGQVLTANRSWCELLRVSPARVRETPVTSFYADPTDRWRMLARLRREGHLRQWATRLKRVDGTFFSAPLSLDLVRLGDQPALLKIVQDVRRPPQAEKPIEATRHPIGPFAAPNSRRNHVESVAPTVGEALRRFAVEESRRESEGPLRSVFETNHHGMLLIDAESGQVVDANPAAAAFYGHTRDRLREMNVRELHSLGPDGGEAWDGPGGQEHPCFSAAVARVAGGELRQVEVHTSPLRGRPRPQLFAIVHDVTERKLLEKRILDIGETERRRIGQDLHDSLGGHLTGLALLGKGLAKKLADQGIGESTIAEELVAGIKEALVQTRAIAHGLCPAGLDVLGLAGSLKAYARSVSKSLGVNCRVEVRGEVAGWDESTASHLYRIVQEAVNNAVRHGKASHIRIQLTQEKDALQLYVCDDGCGLPRQAERTPGLGLCTMRHRATLLGGELQISSQAGEGTVIACRIPVRPFSAARQPEVQ
jgi:two-component system, LuxR family, sensor kinase FixL